MKILQIVPELNVGGVETGTVDLAKYLVSHGHQAVVVSNGGVMVEDLEKAGVKHYSLPVHRKSLWAIYQCTAELARIIQAEKVDIVHARSRVPAWIAFFACRQTKVPFLTTCHGYYRKHFFSKVMGWAKIVIVPSNVIGRHMMDDFGVSSRDIRLIARSVDLEKFRSLRAEPLKGEYVISMVGRITPLKGHEYFFKAMAKVLRSIPNIKIWVIGEAPASKQSYKEELLILIKRLGLSEYVQFLGNRKDVPGLLARSNCLVLATVTEEAFGRVILEAQAAGVPVVATRVGGVVDIIDDEKTGLLVPPKDTQGMSQAVIRILRDKGLAERLTQEAYQKLKAQFTLEQMATKTLEVYEELLRSMRILVVKLSSIGDVILVTASLRAIREKFPNAQIHCLVGKPSSGILQRCPYLDHLIVYDPEHKDKGLFGLFRLAQKSRQTKYDKIIDFQNNTRSHLLTFLSFPQESYGYDNGKLGFLLTHRLKDQQAPLPPVKHQFEILKMLDIAYEENTALELWPSPTDEDYAQSLLDSEWLGNKKQIVGLNIAASQRWRTKNWPLRHIAEFCDLCSKRNWRVIITGLDKDREAAQELLHLTKAKPAIFVGKTDMLQLAALVKRCRVFISPDSAPMHVAAAVGTPFVGLFGPTDPERHLPPARNCVVLRKELSCSPCYSSHCKILTHACMYQITPQELVSAIEKFLEAKR